jgi:hypothetical protein
MCLFNDAVNDVHYKTSHCWMIVPSEIDRVWTSSGEGLILCTTVYRVKPRSTSVKIAYIKGAQIQVAVATKFCNLAPNISGSPDLNLLYVNYLAPRILSCFLDFRKTCSILAYVPPVTRTGTSRLHVAINTARPNLPHC